MALYQNYICITKEYIALGEYILKQQKSPLLTSFATKTGKQTLFIYLFICLFVYLFFRTWDVSEDIGCPKSGSRRNCARPSYLGPVGDDNSSEGFLDPHQASRG